MTEKLKQDVKIQRWVIYLLVPLLPILLGFTINSVVSFSNVNSNSINNSKRIDENCYQIEKLDNEKADKDIVDRNYELLQSINNKLDNYILKNN